MTLLVSLLDVIYSFINWYDHELRLIHIETGFVLVAAICVYIWCDYVNKRTQNENSEEVYTKILSDTKNDRLEMGKPVEYVYGS